MVFYTIAFGAPLQMHGLWDHFLGLALPGIGDTGYPFVCRFGNVQISPCHPHLCLNLAMYKMTLPSLRMSRDCSVRGKLPIVSQHANVQKHMSKNVRNDMHPCPNSNRFSNDSVQNSNLVYICKEGWAEHKETTLQTTSNQVHIIWPIMDPLSSKACNPDAMKT